MPPVIGLFVTADENAVVLISRAPPVMPPAPSALKVPAIAMKSEVWSFTLPTIEYTYVPFRLLLEKEPLGGGVTLGMLPLPPQPASIAIAENTNGTTRRFRTNITSP